MSAAQWGTAHAERWDKVDEARTVSTATGTATGTATTTTKATAQALEAMTEAWASVEAARQHAYEYHRHAGLSDAHLLHAVALLRSDGHHDLADSVCRHLVGKGIGGHEGRWTFQLDENHDDDFARTLQALEEQVRSRSQAG
jgi:hypothetical protein